MITSSFSLTATERVLPKLALDFTTASLDPRVTFTRTTDATHPATYVNSSGNIASSTNNAPRFDYDPATLVCKGLLIEESRSNLITSSSDFTSGWIKTAGTAIATSTDNSPDGVNKAQQVTFSTSGDYLVFLITPYNVVTGQTLTFTIYTKTANRAIQFGGATTAGTDVYSISAFNNGWYRQQVTRTFTTTTASGIVQAVLIGSQIAGLGPYSIWGAQLEAGAFATSYIPTTSAALTRNADVATMTGTNFSDWYNATAGSANVSATQKSIGGTAPLVQFDDNTANNIISLRSNAANPELYIKTTTDQAQIDAGTIVANTAYKLTGAWNTDNCAAAQNGAAVVTDTSATIPTVTQARIGSDGTNYANAWLQKINYWQQRITNNEVQAFSK